MLAAWQRRWTRGTFEIAKGPASGFADNFRSLVINARTEAPYVAFSDQDDIWLAGKLSAAIAVMAGDEEPALYGSRMTFADAAGKAIAPSPVFKKAPSFENALAQNIIAGNTAVFNRAGFEVLRLAAERTHYAFHDWFSYLIVSGAGGTVHYSAASHLLYRQHGGNAVGGSMTFMHKASRVRRALRGTFRKYVDQNIAGLRACEDLLTNKSVATLDLFEAARHGPPGERLKMLKASGVHRQTRAETLMLYAACAMGQL